ncbi:S8 family peptidase [Ellagibacter isourolithinifaciens]|uniref:S8 family peptidase n=1 Tax=Ellagibacter isourolithinifaciens TaxID=2137581 RepID=UPI002E77AEC4|nr:S8 family serine peptidase [Ellagibacter isourolithinifaciens]MEE0044566.1 S8 family serine peptidase [Ellagibacter isourolithinifaciens]
MLAAILAVGIAFPAPALAFADDAADANKSAGESAVDTTAISEGATQANDPALFDELVEGVDYRGLLVTLDEDSKINLLSEDGGESELAQGLADAGLAVTNQIESADGSTLAVADVADDMRASEAVAAAQEVPGVVSVQPNFVYRLVDEVPAGALDESAASIADEQVEGDEGISAQALGMPNDDYVYTRDPNEPYNQYWLYTTRITRAWNLVHADNTVTVATLDTGVDFDHADLEDNLLMDYAWDAYNSKPLSASVPNGDRIGHGTMVAGIISARANNGIGLAGASFNATILPVKVFNDTGAPEATTASVLSGYKYVVDLATSKTVSNLRVINTSFGSYNTYSSSGYCLKDEALRKAIVSAKNAGIVTVCSGGNGKDGKPRTDNIYPADFDECVAVTALNTDNTNCYWSDYNKKKNISAPGLLVTTTDATGGYSKASGTSMAAPIVSGVFALLFAAEPVATVDDACNAVYATATPISDAENDRTDISGSHGAIDASAAVEALEGLGRTAFSDVHPGEWFYNAVYFAKAHGIMNGVGDTGEFQPSAPTTRAQAATVLYNVYSKGEVASSCNKPDVDQSEWYANAVNWCVAHGIMTGYDDGSNTFGPNDSLTREQMCKVLAIATKADYASADPAKYNALLGTEETDEWARPFVVWAVDEGLVNGVDNHDGTHTLDPLGLVYRCQTAQIFTNAITAGIM